jgi:hypothetical protein
MATVGKAALCALVVVSFLSVHHFIHSDRAAVRTAPIMKLGEVI